MHPTKGPFSCLTHSNGGCLQQAVVAGLATLPKRILHQFLRSPKIKYINLNRPSKKQDNVKLRKNFHFSKLKKNQFPKLTASSWSYKHQSVAHTDGVNELHHLNRSSAPFCSLKNGVPFPGFPFFRCRKIRQGHDSLFQSLDGEVFCELEILLLRGREKQYRLRIEIECCVLVDFVSRGMKARSQLLQIRYSNWNHRQKLKTLCPSPESGLFQYCITPCHMLPSPV